MQAAPLVLGIAGAVLHVRRKPQSPSAEQGTAPPSTPPPTPPRSPGSALAVRAPAPAVRVRRLRAPLVLCCFSLLLSLAIVAAVVTEQPRRRLIYLAACSALCSASALLLLLRIRRSLRVVKRTPRQLPRPDELNPSSLDAKLLRPISQPALDELAQQLTGYWHKDMDASDPMDGPLNIVHAPWLVRQAVNLIVGLEMKLTSSEFYFTVCSRIQWFKIREVFVVGGEGRRLQRRDLRGGGSLGRCAITKEGIWLSTEWEDPYPGNELAHFSVSGDGLTLTIRSRILLRDGHQVDYTTIYRKRVTPLS